MPVVKALSKLVAGKKQFAGSKAYWENRYKTGGHSGAGSYNNLALFKAEVLNKFVVDHQIKSVIEFGSGDGNQLKLFQFPLYTGVDVSHAAIEQCKRIFAGDETKRFVQSASFTPTSADMALSLDVIYHLVEDVVFDSYMRQLFESGERFVIVYSSNYEDDGTYASHVRPRKFTEWVEKNTSFRLLEMIPNAFPFDAEKPESTSFADFYIYERK
ncbi:MAG: hypothetical protein GC193_04505 [Cryomorphaceae bacterium]|nr:hypothetical protein [Cryomorphaceae bacterium]